MIFSENRFPLFRLMLMLGMYVDNAARVVHRSGMSSLAPAGAATLLRQPSLIFFLLSRSLSRFSSQIGAVAIGWQIYDLTGRAFDLGMVGLIQFLPTALLVFVAGSAADRYPRRRVMQLCQAAEAVTALYLCWGSYAGVLSEVQLFAATF